VSQWHYWVGTDGRAYNSKGLIGANPRQAPPRTELAIGGALGNAGGGSDRYLPTTIEGLISVENSTMWKLLFGYTVSEAIWTGPKFPNSSTKTSDWDTSVNCSMGCLFNLTNDPEERHDVASVFPQKVVEMSSRIATLNRTVFSPNRGKRDPRACEIALRENHGFWGPFENGSGWSSAAPPPVA
jgi:hypothetical protein